MNFPFLDLKAVHAPIMKELQDTAAEVIEAGAFIKGPYLAKFEEQVGTYLGVKHAIGVNSGTDALVLALLAHGVKAGDEVIAPSWTFFATSESISQVGAIPVFVDIDLHTFNLDLAEVEKAISAKTKVIMPVHLYGRPCDMTGLVSLAEKHGLTIIEDTAQAFGASWGGQKAGTFGTGAYSFFPSKNLGGLGDGGLVVSNDDGIADRVRMLREHGGKQKYRNEILGFNSRLDGMQAALLSVKLPHLDAWNAGRVKVAEQYFAAFSGTAVVAPEVCEGHVFHQYTVLLPEGSRDQAEVRLKEAGIPSMVYYPVPNHKLPVYETLAHIRSGALPVTMNAAGRVISLPIWPGMAEEKIEIVAKGLLQAIA